MKFRIKKLSFILVIVMAIGFLAGCTPKEIKSKPENIKLDSGFLIHKDEKDSSIILSINEEDYTLLVEDNDLFNSLNLDEFYLVSYIEDETKGKIVKSIETNENLKDLLLKSNEDIIEEPKGDIVAEEIFPVDPVSLEYLILLDEYIIDFNKDNIDDKVCMYVAAERDDKGEIMWDDGHRWLFVVHDKEKDYVLFDNWVQLGRIQSYVYTIEDDFYIATLTTGTANLTLKSYFFDKTHDKFVLTTPFKTEGNVNMQYRSQW